MSEGRRRQSYRDLVVWQKAVDLTVLVYDTRKAFPSDERFGLVTQMRRAAISVASNIAEGYGRDADGSFAQFLRIAQGSLKELETQTIIGRRVELIARRAEAVLLGRMDEIGRMLRALIRKVAST